MTKLVKLWRGLAAIFMVLFAFAIGATSAAFENAGFVNMALNVNEGSVSGSDGEYVYKSAYTKDGKPSDAGLDALLADAREFCETELEEGSVLLENNGALPLTADERKVTLFGRSTADPVYRNSAAGGYCDPSIAVSLRAALETAGFAINAKLFDAYAASTTQRVLSADGVKNDIGEEPISFYTDSLKGTFAEYSDAAIVMFSRDGGEGYDKAVSDSDGVRELSLHPDELDLLGVIRDSRAFEKTIVLVNSNYPLELGALEEYGVDACLWIGTPAVYGFHGVADILTGDANPSGRLTDTYAENSISAPAMRNFGDYAISGDSASTKYIVYAEGIYVGYKYYETRYEDLVLNRYGASSAVGSYASGAGGWNYADEVLYPFGYGLSYTEFTQTVVPDSFSYNAETDTFSLEVEVVNVGDHAGKSVVELYVQTPYTQYDINNKVEKSSVVLAGFAKTDKLESGGGEKSKQTVTITVDRYLLASYDAYGSKHYILDGGDYYFAIGDDSHDALNNILAAKDDTLDLIDVDGMSVEGDADKCIRHTIGTAGVTDIDTYAYSDITGNEITNAFIGRDAIDANDFYDSDVVTYLSRSSWDTTWPSIVSLSHNADISDALDSEWYTKPSDAPSVSDITLGKDAGLSFYDMIGTEYKDDEKWSKFLGQLTLDDLIIVINDSGGQKVVQRVNKPPSKNCDGPDGVNANYKFGNKGNATCYAPTIVAASSWNTAMMEKFGELYGEDMLYTGTHQTWGPGTNIHRTPFSGRNFEYYSEDGVFTYLISVPQIRGLRSKGAQVALKHFVANEYETNRRGMATFLNEQTMREIYLKAFEGAVTKGGAMGIMTAYNRVGCVIASASAPLQNTILRGEWGFKGYTITDAASAESSYMPTAECILTGTDMFCVCGTRGSVLKKEIENTDDGHLLEALLEVNKHYYYTMINTSLINGLTKDSQVADSVAWWKIAMVSIDVVLGVAAAVMVILYALPRIVARRKKA